MQLSSRGRLVVAVQPFREPAPVVGSGFISSALGGAACWCVALWGWWPRLLSGVGGWGLVGGMAGCCCGIGLGLGWRPPACRCCSALRQLPVLLGCVPLPRAELL